MLVAHEWGVPFARMNEAFTGRNISEMRMELSSGLAGSEILNDAYNASPTSMKAVLDLVSSLKGLSEKDRRSRGYAGTRSAEEEYHLEIGEYIRSG